LTKSPKQLYHYLSIKAGENSSCEKVRLPGFPFHKGFSPSKIRREFKMVEWVKVGTSVVVGGAAGAVDQLVQNADDKRLVEKPDLGIMAQYGTYLNYGVPILSILGVAMGWIRGDWAVRAVTAGSQLAGRKIVKQVAKPAAASWSAWNPKGLDVARQRAMLEARARSGRSQVGGEVSPIGIPIITNETVLV